jgi:hypothetical protein
MLPTRELFPGLTQIKRVRFRTPHVAIRLLLCVDQQHPHPDECLLKERPSFRQRRQNGISCRIEYRLPFVVDHELLVAAYSMPGAGLEPAWPFGRGILSPLVGSLSVWLR